MVLSNAELVRRCALVGLRCPDDAPIDPSFTSELIKQQPLDDLGPWDESDYTSDSMYGMCSEEEGF